MEVNIEKFLEVRREALEASWKRQEASKVLLTHLVDTKQYQYLQINIQAVLREVCQEIRK